MKKWIGAIIVVTITLLLGGAAWASASQQVNLLRNPSFEGEPIIWENAGEVKIAPEWEPFHWDGLTGYPAIDDGNLKSVPTARPEYRPATLTIDPVRVHSGQQSQMWFSFYRNHFAGVTQRNVPVQAGQTYTVSVWAQAWSSAGDDPRKSEAEIYLTIGINPRGDCSRTAKDTVWSNWMWVGATYKRVESQSVRMVSGTACVHIWSSTKYSVKHNDMYIDDAEMTLVAQGNCPDCPVCPTPTPCPTCPECPSGAIDYNLIRTIFREELNATRLRNP